VTATMARSRLSASRRRHPRQATADNPDSPEAPLLTQTPRGAATRPSGAGTQWYQDQALTHRAYDTYLTEACARAVEVVGTLPAKDRDLAGPGVTRPDQRPAPNTGSAQEIRRPTVLSQAEQRRAALSKLAAGQTVSGSVKSLTPFGAFASLGEIDDLIHISQLTTHHVQHPSEVVGVGETVTVLVLDVDVARQPVSLSVKAATSTGSGPSRPEPESPAPSPRTRRSG
jgi:predicted RNA-binding protein with RPS1 domain